MIYHNFLLFKMDISLKIELRQKSKFAQTLLLYSSQKYDINKKKIKKICKKKNNVLIIPLNILIINIIFTK